MRWRRGGRTRAATCTGKGLVGGSAAVRSVAKCPGVAFRVGEPPKLIDQNDATMQKPRVRRLSTDLRQKPMSSIYTLATANGRRYIVVARPNEAHWWKWLRVRSSSDSAPLPRPQMRRLAASRRCDSASSRFAAVSTFLEAAAPARARACQAALRAAAAAQRARTRRYAPGAAVRSDRTPTAAGCNSEIAEPRALAPKRWPSAITP